MLNSNQVGTVLFKLSDIKKLNLNRLKAFKKACETRQRNFTTSCGCDTKCYRLHVKTSPGDFATGDIEEYKIWSANMTMICDTLKSLTS